MAIRYPDAAKMAYGFPEERQRRHLEKYD